MMQTGAAGGAALAADCYHCGLEIPAGVELAVAINGAPRALCCGGCQAVARAIVAAGLASYYSSRDALPESPRTALPAELEELGLFDHPQMQKNFVRPVGEHEREAALIIEGVTCAACVWLNEAHLAGLPGVLAAHINYTTRRARVRWDERRIRLSQILAAIHAIGYRAHPYDTARAEEVAGRERRSALWRLFVAGFGMMQVMMYAVPVYLATAGTMTPDIEQLMRWASLLLTLPVILYSARPFFSAAWRDITLRRVGMDLPVALGVGSAFIASCWATLRATGDVYFDSVTMFVFFLLVGRYLELMARQKAARGVEALAAALPAFAERFIDAALEQTERVGVAELQVGDVLRVKPGATLPADGVIVAGESSVDEALLTGESMPVKKTVDARVIGGSTNIGGPLMVKVEQVGEATRLAMIRRLMERAASEKPRAVLLADRYAMRFVLALLLLAALTGGLWLVLDPARALWIFVAVLVVSCPCALSLATPAALTVATGALARQGLLVTRGHTIETLARATVFVFDKTGTLTEGRPRVLEVKALGMAASEALRLAAAIEQGSEHPLGQALRAAAQDVALPAAQEVRAFTGQGMSALVEGRRLRIGKPEFAGMGLPPLADIENWQGDTVVALADERQWLALFRISDSPRAGVGEALARLRQSGLRLAVLSGDAPTAVAKLCAQLGVTDFAGGMTPEDKHAWIQRLQQTGAVVAMVGDGVNDAPVLAQAHVSIAMGGGADLARAQADAVLLNNDLAHLAAGVSMARRCRNIIRQNLAWALAYNLVTIPLAMLGWVTPWLAGIGMSASSLLVVLNALRLQKHAADS